MNRQFCKILESSLQQLETNTERAFGPDREDNSSLIRITTMAIVPYQDSIQVKCKVHNSQDQTDYSSNILIQGIRVGTEGEFDLDIMTTSGDLISVSKNALEEAEVRVNCTCLDFHWRFALWNFNDGSLLGKKPKPYIKKTNRPPNNPQRLPGLCKHLIAVKQHFERQTES